MWESPLFWWKGRMNAKQEGAFKLADRSLLWPHKDSVFSTWSWITTLDAILPMRWIKVSLDFNQRWPILRPLDDLDCCVTIKSLKMVQAWVHKKKFTAGFWIHRYARVHACLNRQKPIYTSKEHGITARKFTTGRSGTFRGSKSLHCVTVERMLGKGNTAKIRNKRQGSDENHQYLSAPSGLSRTGLLDFSALLAFISHLSGAACMQVESKKSFKGWSTHRAQPFVELRWLDLESDTPSPV